MNVLIIETCEQMNSSLYLHEDRNFTSKDNHLSVMEFLKPNAAPTGKIIGKTIVDNLFIMPAARGMDEHFATRFHTFPMGYMTLKMKLQELRKFFDLIIIDTPPNLGCMQMLAISASTHYLYIHSGCKGSLDGIKRMEKKINEIPKNITPELECLGIVRNEVAKPSKLDEVVGQLTHYAGIPFVDITIPYAAAVKKGSYNVSDTYWMPNIFNKKRIYMAYDIKMYKLAEHIFEKVGLIQPQEVE
jgi:cellulose biosynthesis protein BcsQ